MSNLTMFLLLAVIVIVIALVIRRGNSAESAKVIPPQTETHHVELGKLEQAKIEIKMRVGKLTLRGGASDLVNGTFIYNIAAWKPQITSGDGKVTISHKSTQKNFNFKDLQQRDKYRSEWDIALNNDVDLTLLVEAGAGKSTLDLSGLTLSEAKISAGVGSMLVDLSGDWQQDTTIKLESGVGEITIKLPESVGISAQINKGIGSINVSNLSNNGSHYTNALYGKADVTLSLALNTGVGSITLI